MTDLSRARAEPPVQSEAEGRRLKADELVVLVQPHIRGWLDWCEEADEAPDAASGARIAVNTLLRLLNATLAVTDRAHAEEVERLTAENDGLVRELDHLASERAVLVALNNRDDRNWESLKARAEAAEAKLAATPPNASAAATEAASRFLTDFDELVGDSHGVAGLHLNGEVAPWSDLLSGGRFEEWLASAEALRSALAKADAGGRPGPVAGEVTDEMVWAFDHEIFRTDVNFDSRLERIRRGIRAALLASRQTPKPDAGSSGEVDAGGWRPMADSGFVTCRSFGSGKAQVVIEFNGAEALPKAQNLHRTIVATRAAPPQQPKQDGSAS